ncbi:NfeD family protein [Chloroflexota bacterium]
MPELDLDLFQIDTSLFRIETWQMVIAVIIVIIFLIIAINYGIKAHRRQIASGREELIGKIAEVKIALDPKGTVSLQGELWAAISETGRIEPQEEVIVTRVNGLKLYVKNKGGN